MMLIKMMAVWRWVLMKVAHRVGCADEESVSFEKFRCGTRAMLFVPQRILRGLMVICCWMFLMVGSQSVHAVKPMVVAGDIHSLALKSDGTLVAWGDDSYGQLGRGRILYSATPIIINKLEQVKAVAEGVGFRLALKQDGTVWAWGKNQNGQLGDGTYLSRTVPVQVKALSDISAVIVDGGMTAIADETEVCYALKKDGTVWAWGSGNKNKIGDGIGETHSVPTPFQIQGLNNVVDIKTLSGKVNGPVALKLDGSVWIWTAVNEFKSAFAPIPELNNVGAMSVAYDHIIALKKDGTLAEWNGGIVRELKGLNGVTAIYAKHYQGGFALKNEGTLWAWGRNNYGQLGDGTTYNRSEAVQVIYLNDVVDFVTTSKAGSELNFALKKDGTVWSWGGKSKQLIPSQIKNLIGITAIFSHVDYALKQDGSLWTLSDPSELKATAWNDIIGFSGHLFLRNDGTVWAWGNNTVGELGDGISRLSAQPLPVVGLSGIVDIEAKGTSSYALRQDGTVWGWGGANGSTPKHILDRWESIIAEIHCGVASKSFVCVPAKSNTASNQGANPDSTTHGVGLSVIAEGFGLLLKNDGTVWKDGVQVPELQEITAVDLSRDNAIALKKDGTVWTSQVTNTIGTRQDLGTFTQTSNLKGVSAIAAGDGLFLAMQSDGSVSAWGWNKYGQIGDGTLSSKAVPVLAINETADGFLDLIPETPNNIPSDKIPPFLMKVTPISLNTNVLVKYDPQTLSQNGNVYVVGFVKANSPLLLNKTGFSAVAPDAVVPVMLTRGGFKQMGAGVPVDAVYSGPLDAANNTFTLYDPANFDNTKDYGVFCVGYATDVGTASAKGQIRAAVTGKIDGAYQCPPIQVNPVSAFTATSNDRTEALTLNAAITPKSEDVGKPMNVYTWAVVPNGSFFVKKPSGWDAMNALQLDTNFTATLTDNLAVPIVDSLDLRSLIGTQAYVGYGSSEKDMLDNARYGLVYTIK